MDFKLVKGSLIMKNDAYIKIILTLIFISSLIFGFLFLYSVDLLRFRIEELAAKVDGLSEMLDGIKASGPGPGLSRARETGGGISREEVANLAFYDAAADEGGRLVTAMMSETKNMNALVNNDSFVSSLWGYTYDSLAQRNYAELDKFEPMLAKRWKISEDKLVYTIELRKGVLWHDFTDPVTGRKWRNMEVTAGDFKFYVDVIKNADTDCAPLRPYFKDMDRIEIISPHEFKVYWNKPYFISKSVTLGLQPLPKHLYHAYEEPFDGGKFNDDHKRNRIIVGCGPYRFVKWDKGQRIILERWEKYWGRKYGIMPPLKKLVFELMKHSSTQLQSLTANKPDSIDRMFLQPEQWVHNTDTPEFGEDGQLGKYRYTSRSYYYIGYNQKNPLFSDRRVRTAMTHLIDRERILEEVYYGLGRIVTGNFFIDSPYYDSSIKAYPFSVEKAVELLAEAGWRDTDGDGILDRDGSDFEFTLLAVAGVETQQRIAPIVREDMEKAGIRMNIAKIEWSVYTQRLEQKNFDVCILGWSLGMDPDPYQVWHSSGADEKRSSNHIGFKNAEADMLIEKIRMCFNLEERIELCHRFHRIMHEEQPYTFLVSRDSLLAQNRRYRNLRIFPGMGVPTRIQWVPKTLQKKGF